MAFFPQNCELYMSLEWALEVSVSSPRGISCTSRLLDARRFYGRVPYLIPGSSLDTEMKFHIPHTAPYEGKHLNFAYREYRFFLHNIPCYRYAEDRIPTRHRAKDLRYHLFILEIPSSRTPCKDLQLFSFVVFVLCDKCN